jgi:hypothetical protein
MFLGIPFVSSSSSSSPCIFLKADCDATTLTPSVPSLTSSYLYTLASIPRHTVAAHKARSGIYSGVPYTKGSERMELRMFPRATTPLQDKKLVCVAFMTSKTLTAYVRTGLTIHDQELREELPETLMDPVEEIRTPKIGNRPSIQSLGRSLPLVRAHVLQEHLTRMRVDHRRPVVVCLRSSGLSLLNGRVLMASTIR